MGPHGADPGDGDVPAVRLDPDRAGGEGDPVPVPSLLGEPREPGPPAPAFPSAGGLPVPVAIHRGLDAVGERLLADLRPPRLTGLPVGALGVLGLVPPLAHGGQGRFLRFLAGLPVPVEVVLQGPHGPVPGVPAAAELTAQAGSLPRGAVQRERERLHRPPVRDHEPSHQRPRTRHRLASRARLASERGHRTCTRPHPCRHHSARARHSTAAKASPPARTKSTSRAPRWRRTP